jgi:oxygen-independent coproporphyrinogen-3 oxidase
LAGIYIHIPFCHRKCIYCDFYSVGKNKLNDDFINLIIQEFSLRKNYLPTEKIETIYFGGGTPSLLSAQSIDEILRGLKRIFEVSSNTEITLEANPDDLSLELLQGYKLAGVNRISIGVQSFNDDELQFLGRRHDSKKAIESVGLIYESGISNVSLDLIYGLPNSTIKSWEYSLQKAIDLNVQHLSCYHLTYEESTPLTRKLRKGNFNTIDEDISLNQFELLRKLSEENGYLHYEVSNFAKEGYVSRHNSSYWQGVLYLGVGPSAHSFNVSTRQWNPSSIDEWANEIKGGRCNFQSETIDETARYNELILTRLRTSWGVDLNFVANGFEKLYIEHLRREMEKQLKLGNLICENNILKIPPERYFISDAILEHLIFV